jgi:hypothetical protein
VSDDSDLRSIEIQQRRNGSAYVRLSGTFNFEAIQHISSLLGDESTTQSLKRPPLIETPPTLPSQFFKSLISEINVAYTYQLYTSTYVCLRKLFENLIIELLRKKFGTTELNLYYWNEKGRFHDFSKLIENFESKVNDFGPHTVSFDQHFFDFLKNFKEAANSNAHSIDIYADSKEFEDKRGEMNHYITLLCEVINSIT